MTFLNQAINYLLVLILIVGPPSVVLAQKKEATAIVCAVLDRLNVINIKKSLTSCERQKIKETPVKLEPTVRKPEPVYETCTTENNYIEGRISLPPLAPVPSTGSNQGEEKLSALCILEAQKNVMSQTSNFAICSKNSLEPKENHKQPCVSEKYHKYVEGAFQAVVQCFGVPAKQMAGILTVESGFHINAQVKNQGSGISQMVEGTIGGINNEHYKNFQKMVQTSPACAQIKPFMKEPINPDRLKRCVALWPPENPVTNLIYGAILYKTNAEIIDRKMLSLKGRLREVMKDGEFAALVDSLKLLSHNDSPGKIMKTLDRFIKRRGLSLRATDFKIEPIPDPKKGIDDKKDYTLPGTFLNFLRRTHPVPGSDEPAPKDSEREKISSRRAIIANYLPKIFGYMKEIEKSNGGLSCLTPGLKKLLR
jgi:hypothetical protein